MEQKKQQIKKYITQEVNVFIQPLVYDIVKARPSNPVNFAIGWLKNYSEKKQQNDNCSDVDSQQEKQTVAELQAQIKKKKLQGKSRSRMAISQQVFGVFNKRQVVQLIEVPKSQQIQFLIKSLIRNSVLFQNLDHRDEDVIVKTMKQREVKQEQIIITEGQRGDQLFVVQSGQYQCSKGGQILKTYHHGQAFGELSLIYNAPRAATVKCIKAGKLYTLDRIVFGQVVKNAATRKRQLFSKVIDSIQIFKQINLPQKQRFMQILKEEKYQQGQYVIKQGQKGNKFYIVLQGQLVAEKVQNINQLPKIVYKYKQADYFGELALMHDINRQASIKALSKVRLACIDRQSFKRIFGNLQQILKRNEQRYQMKKEQFLYT